MRTTTRLALAFVTLAGAAGSVAYADEHYGGQPRHGMMMRLDKAMKDSNGTITFDQFSDAMNTRLKKLVADNGGKLTVAQLADALEKARVKPLKVEKWGVSYPSTEMIQAVGTGPKKMKKKDKPPSHHIPAIPKGDQPIFRIVR